jgi:hypothetical protein
MSSGGLIKLEKDPQGEEQFIKDKVTTRGEGLSNLLGMKRDFNTFCMRVSYSLIY